MALVNGLITLVVLLIAPLGLATVISLTALIVLSTIVCDWTGDRLLLYLAGDQWNQHGRRAGKSNGRRSRLPEA